MTTTDKVVLAIGSVAIIGAAIIGTAVFTGSSNNTSEPATSQSPTTSTAQTTTSEATSSDSTSSQSESTSTTSSYKDGSYTSNATYSVPHGSNSISVTLTIKDGVITTVSTDNSYTDHESGMYIDAFEQSLESKVVGQSIASLSPSRIGGASLTTEGFNDAINTIRSQAQA